MDGKTILLSAIIVCAIAAGIIILVGTGGLPPVAGQRGRGMMMDSDRMFIEQMIPHHQDAVDMGELALVRAEHQEIKQLAATIIRDQSREITLMRDWYRAWFGSEIPEYQGMGGGGMGMMEGMAGNPTDLIQLANATPFDKEFIEQMIPHHQMAIMMAQMVMRHSDRQEIRELGSSIIQTQSAEVDLMQAWYRDWYGKEFVSSPMMGQPMDSRWVLTR
jgi:uncharacterized protein (DUF305 family)